VRGYQTSGTTAQAFTFSSTDMSLAAEKLGVTDEIGVITAYFFAEQAG
jgi:hypothetical protein